MAERKTRRTAGSVEAFIASLDGEARRADCTALVAMMKKAAKGEPWMYGSSIVGFGSYHYESGGKKLEAPRVAFSPRKSELVVYLMPGFEDSAALLQRLGKHRHGKSCLYIKSLDQVDRKVLQALIDDSIVRMQKTHPD